MRPIFDLDVKVYCYDDKLLVLVLFQKQHLNTDCQAFS